VPYISSNCSITVCKQLPGEFFWHTCIFNTFYQKIDLDRLKQDLPKWKPWLSANSWPEWADVLESGREDF